MRRELDCRLTPDRALETLDDARAFLDDRGMLTLTPDCSLPSLFGACHEEPYSDAPGFGSWPKTKYWWGGALDALATRLHRGKTLYLSQRVAVAVDPLCRAELARAEAGELGPEAERIVTHLADAGPSLVEELKEEPGLDKKTRQRLERVGAVVSRGVVLELRTATRASCAAGIRRWSAGRRQTRSASCSSPASVRRCSPRSARHSAGSLGA
jgi:hypothetical protein